jgi:hypothetical protein
MVLERTRKLRYRSHDDPLLFRRFTRGIGSVSEDWVSALIFIIGVSGNSTLTGAIIGSVWSSNVPFPLNEFDLVSLGIQPEAVITIWSFFAFTDALLI